MTWVAVATATHVVSDSLIKRLVLSIAVIDIDIRDVVTFIIQKAEFNSGRRNSGRMFNLIKRIEKNYQILDGIHSEVLGTP